MTKLIDLGLVSEETRATSQRTLADGQKNTGCNQPLKPYFATGTDTSSTDTACYAS